MSTNVPRNHMTVTPTPIATIPLVLIDARAIPGTKETEQAAIFLALTLEVNFWRGGLNSSVSLTSLDYKNYTEKLLSYLEPVLLSSKRSRFVRCWHAKTDGWAASTFHSNCNGRGPTVTIIKAVNSMFGGYTDVSWSGSCVWSYAIKAFLFSFNNTKGYNPVKLTQYRYQQYAMYRCSFYGPTFGRGHDIHVSNDAGINQ
ncbi:hypothetical protein AWC38_SpisGene10350 [Stylophora pistillata]|uniref:TLDc domain-containing protein n=1 Tax=Stylophora pistillata TaxID=50429 RepID=A0A2B4S6K3_STYPI|nr:hypothetical protein AWC38_SpisGene10350 [Stylophora pistillata]